MDLFTITRGACSICQRNRSLRLVEKYRNILRLFRKSQGEKREGEILLKISYSGAYTPTRAFDRGPEFTCLWPDSFTSPLREAGPGTASSARSLAQMAQHHGWLFNSTELRPLAQSLRLRVCSKKRSPFPMRMRLRNRPPQKSPYRRSQRGSETRLHLVASIFASRRTKRGVLQIVGAQ